MKIIHQIFLDIGLQPLEERTDYLKNIRIVKELNPDWEYKLWNDDSLTDFISNYYPENMTNWNNFPYPFYKIDYARYMLLHHYGGIYIDLDEQNLKPLEDFKVFYGKWYDKTKNIWNINNNIMMIQDKTICKKLLDYINNEIVARKKSIPPSWKCRLLLHTVGVRAWARFIKKNKLVSDGDYHDYFKTDCIENCSWITTIKNN